VKEKKKGSIRAAVRLKRRKTKSGAIGSVFAGGKGAGSTGGERGRN